MFAFTVFLLVAALALVPLGLGPALVMATLAALAADGLALAALRRAVSTYSAW